MVICSGVPLTSRGLPGRGRCTLLSIALTLSTTKPHSLVPHTHCEVINNIGSIFSSSFQGKVAFLMGAKQAAIGTQLLYSKAALWGFALTQWCFEKMLTWADQRPHSDNRLVSNRCNGVILPKNWRVHCTVQIVPKNENENWWKKMLKQTGSQFKEAQPGEICSDFLVPV